MKNKMSEASRFHIPFISEKMNFSVWNSSIEVLLVQQGIDDDPEKTKPAFLEVEK